MEGNPKDSELYEGTLKKLKKDYGKTPESSVADGGFASKENIEYSQKVGIINIVFNKIRGSMQNITNSKWIENKLKRWRSGIEAIISNLKRGFQIRRGPILNFVEMEPLNFPCLSSDNFTGL